LTIKFAQSRSVDRPALSANYAQLTCARFRILVSRKRFFRLSIQLSKNLRNSSDQCRNLSTQLLIERLSQSIHPVIADCRKDEAVILLAESDLSTVAEPLLRNSNRRRWR
jgi:hypothetical protein